MTRPTTDRPLRKDAVRNRQRVIDAARDLFATRGLDATLNEVAHHGGIGVGTVYRRFPTKEALFEAIFEDAIDEIAAMADLGLEFDDSWQGFAWFVEQMCQQTATDRGLREILYGKGGVCNRVDAARTRLVPKLAKLVERAQKDGYLRPGITDSDMPILGLLAGTVSEFAGHVDADLWRRYVAIFLDGLRDRDGQATLPVDALDADHTAIAMTTSPPTP
ncbi:TetR/AcrR family transcriptional regulator [Mycobacterium sp. CBMA293]|uniref:TetR/AcrR family transcriptional regulator n=1 Tax=unclassified Mycolicibacterium TaxID=2636767 RepID=UPI0012DC79E6|nr:MULTISPECIES: TetR/AcrR family transcriptional regulator [unclassified Mycolicibacterium]MUL47205.1 TetR/AcrR family transcriptional regulator [Mycolicibacterium sp. CBMA 360]MUL61314.1 TetR/AcrR family transcriptional regulator [Mycolicibacterium sp. CBMA 335]MUL72049.1 TetR/AcrR family transcriptional regulator [Mycolicibacterium sp. CBMA 311]MUL96216.1 TetR/AcrR family transcriptional regulator [Mycolicibacterium sp. CBMA 230]MUM08960.1 TetR family transcriptional regulator [Mycolicibact